MRREHSDARGAEVPRTWRSNVVAEKRAANYRQKVFVRLVSEIMNSISEYEKQRLRNIEENKRVLASLGLTKSILPKPLPRKPKQGIKRKRVSPQRPKKVARDDALLQDLGDWTGYMTRRRSGRLLGKDPETYEGYDIEIEEDEKPRKPVVRNRENVFGSIPDVPVGRWWATRIECSADGIHRPTVAGIHGNANEGCYSLALSGGYEDDLDYGTCFTYTGEGGRDLKGTKSNPKNLRTAPQSKDQTLSRGNMALTKNVENQRPVRVIRGYKLDSPYAPEEGYRYDGLYTVEKYWQAVGMSGFMVYKFALKRCEGQAPPPWEDEDVAHDAEQEFEDRENQQEDSLDVPPVARATNGRVTCSGESAKLTIPNVLQDQMDNEHKKHSDPESNGEEKVTSCSGEVGSDQVNGECSSQNREKDAGNICESQGSHGDSSDGELR